MSEFALGGFMAFLKELGGITLFVHKVWRTLLHTRGNLRPILEQISYVSYRSLSTVAVKSTRRFCSRLRAGPLLETFVRVLP